ncbi:hypothetical protein MCAL160_0504 [Mycoplasmopsis californica HAZ160_1]|uniref:DUF3899 domain-containing protein n=1 Tax=Mycoplasmopsis californica HAZ160_1 TaxID=1397850 RepID=A0AAT9F859_9BACT|nr:hypothetical protein [Mycoplasmopsis californica]BAP01055.1 hypothetical protein MCAL160_0504 [Mycoplasmopsis californica HAZ160_1]BBG40920.1 hypothetical protein MCAL106_0504 [Mycoplasmopsis californica]BBG41514.1 hypothetical protein MCAL106E_0504 [Mycoplasmopsis californica]BBG42107.1 hypothetical protein MCAL106L_0504 [Mycoplasmopsis californica]BBG42690.1 hypothetical protein MCAL160E_0504 [Mycoplasmopsis californica]
MNQYFRSGLRKLRLIHLFIVVVIGLIFWAAIISILVLNYKKTFKTAFSDSGFVAGFFWIAYGIVFISARLGLGSSWRSMSSSRRDAKIRREMDKIRNKNLLSDDDKISLKIMQQNLDQNLARDEVIEQERRNQLIYFILIGLGLIQIIIAVILAYI